MSTTVRLPLRVEQTLAMYCVENRRTKSEVIIEALEQKFSGAARPAPTKTPYELAIETGFLGCFEGTGESGNYKERVKAAIRKKHKR